MIRAVALGQDGVLSFEDDSAKLIDQQCAEGMVPGLPRAAGELYRRQKVGFVNA
jgi:hypothetical protein